MHGTPFSFDGNSFCDYIVCTMPNYKPTLGVITMAANEIEHDLELKRILWACYQYWHAESLPPDERTICYKWVLGTYENRFRTKFHQSGLRRLTKLRFLKQDDTSRGGHRRYYKIVDPGRVSDLLSKWNLKK